MAIEVVKIGRSETFFGACDRCRSELKCGENDGQTGVTDLDNTRFVVCPVCSGRAMLIREGSRGD